MKKMKKLVLVLAIAALATAAYFRLGPVHGSCGEHLTWTLNRLTGHLSIEGSGDMTIGYVRPWADSKAVWFDYTDQIRSVRLPEGLTSIYESAFAGCDALTSVTIPGSVTSIGNSAFSGCSSLTSVTISEGVTSIGENAFSSCLLSSITIPNSVTTIRYGAFAFCRNLADVTVPDSVTNLDSDAFHLTPFEKSCYTEDGLYYAGSWLLKGEEAITMAEIQEGTFGIADMAFFGRDHLTSVTIPNSVTSIGDSAFLGCGSLAHVTIPCNVTSIGNNAFGFCGALTEDRFTIHGAAGSEAERYAEDNGFDFVSE